MTGHPKKFQLHRCFLALLIMSAVMGCNDEKQDQDNEFVTDTVSASEREPLIIASHAGCAIDADCANGLYCFLGHCAYDCNSAEQCGAGEICSKRGKCTLPASEPDTSGSGAKANPASTLAASGIVDQREPDADAAGGEMLPQPERLSPSPHMTGLSGAGVAGEVSVINVPPGAFTVDMGQTTVAFILKLNAMPADNQIEYTVSRSDALPLAVENTPPR
ncbi:MAG: hypothetical protein JXR76_08540 [Deltaproteobacteria bacterium]|nr:hypothetical protein [Deltaproteobacteria bacterium]